jgi:hypothetical protein
MTSPRILLAAAFASAALLAASTSLADTTRPAAPAHAGKHCLDEGRSKAIVNQTLAGQVNPLGSEHHLLLSVCVPLIRTPGVLYDFTNIEVGLSNYLSPTYVHQGGFLTITPLSVIQLRAEFSGIYIWSIPIDGAGYYPYQSFEGDFSNEARPAETAGHARGSTFNVSATLRGQVGLPKDLSLLLANTVLAEHWNIGPAPFYYNLRRDIILQKSDWTVRNTFAALVEIPISENLAVRAGVTDELTTAPSSGYATNVAALLATGLVRRYGSTIRNLQLFVRAGIYTHHASVNKFRTGEANLITGVNVLYDLSSPPAE